MIWNRPDLMNRLAGLLWGLGLLLILVSGVLMVIRMPFFPVRDVVLTKPLERVQLEDIRAGIAPFIGGNFFTVDLKAIRQGAEQQPWVYRADVRRQGFGSLALSIDEQVPTARWGNEGTRTTSEWLNRDGEVFEVEKIVAHREQGVRVSCRDLFCRNPLFILTEIPTAVRT